MIHPQMVCGCQTPWSSLSTPSGCVGAGILRVGRKTVWQACSGSYTLA